ncbi:hypothetical protein D3C86_1909050 [compost metagenome]
MGSMGKGKAPPTGDCPSSLQKPAFQTMPWTVKVTTRERLASFWIMSASLPSASRTAGPRALLSCAVVLLTRW